MKQNNLSNNVDIKKEYAELWNKDSLKMNANGLYNWMSNQINHYKTILEIGCGSGISTLNLLRNGHNVICVEFNSNFIDMTKKLLNENGYDNIDIINEQISEVNCINVGKKIKSKVDLIICWCPGGIDSLTDEEKAYKEEEFLMSGYPLRNNLYEFSSDYAEDLTRSVLKLAMELNVDAHIIDRHNLNESDANEYMKFLEELKIEYNFKEIITSEILGPANENTMRTNETIKYKSYLFKR